MLMRIPCFLALLGACASPTHVQQLTKTKDLPAVVAVLPLAGSDLPEEVAALLRVQVGNAFEQRGYVKLDDGWVDQRLALAGFRPWERDWLPVDEIMDFFGLANDIDGLVFLEGFAADSLTTGVYNDRSLHGRFRVLDTRQGDSTWIFDVSADEAGGALLQSGQIFDAVANTIGDDDRDQAVRLASLLALAAAEHLPRNERLQPVERRPQVTALRAAANGANNTVDVVVEGSPGCRAFASLPGCLGRYPLAEESAGRYAGALPAPSDSPQVVAFLRDRVGATSRPMSGAVAPEHRP